MKFLIRKSPPFSWHLVPFRPMIHAIHSSMKELITVKLSWYILYTLCWQPISTQSRHLEAKNIKCLKRTVYNCIERY